MAGDLNRVFLLGRLTRDPESRQVGSGVSLCRFSIANNRIFSQDGQKREEVSFFNCTAWGRLAEIIQQYCHKGKQVALEGRLRQSSWQDNEGKKRSNVEVVVEQLQLLGSAQDRSAASGGNVSAFEDGGGGFPPAGMGEEQQGSSFQPVTMGSPQPGPNAAKQESEGGGGASSQEEEDDIPF